MGALYYLDNAARPVKLLLKHLVPREWVEFYRSYVKPASSPTYDKDGLTTIHSAHQLKALPFATAYRNARDRRLWNINPGGAATNPERRAYICCWAALHGSGTQR